MSNDLGDILVCAGGEVKAIGEGVVGGYLVLYGAEDLVGDVFTPSTDLWLEGKKSLPLLYEHGRSKVMKHRRLAQLALEPSDRGIWVQGKLDLSEPGTGRIWDGIKSGAFGWSSGSASHLVERVPRNGAYELKSWPLIEASITRTPAQPKQRVVALKSLDDDDDGFFETIPTALSEVIRFEQVQLERLLSKISRRGET